MEKIVRMLQKPEKHFSKDNQLYRGVIDYNVYDQSPFFWEDACVLAYVQAGTGILRVNQTVYHLEPGSFCVLHQYHVFGFECDSLEPLELQVLVYPYHELAYLFTKESPDDILFAEAPVVKFSDEETKGKVELLYDTYRQESERNDLSRNLILVSILDQLRSIYAYAYQESPLFPVPLCADIFQYIGVHSLSPLSIKHVADQFGISEARVNQELRRVCLENFKVVLSHAQVCNACTFLLRTKASGPMLAASSGFTSESALYRSFYKWRGTTPQQYRQQLCESSPFAISGIDDVLLEIQVYIYENFRSEISCETCAQALYLSAPAITRTLNEHYGPDVTFRNLLQHIRLQYAEALLVASDLPIGDVALEAGFNSIHTFNRIFKQHHKLPPSQFRVHRREALLDDGFGDHL